MASPEVGKKMPTCFSGLLAALTPSSKKHWKEKKDAERDAFLRRPRRASEARSMFFDPRERTGVRKSLSKGWKKEFPGTPHAASRKMHELEISPDPSSEDDEDDRRKLRHGDKPPGYESMGAAARSFMRTGSDDSLKEVLDSTTNQHRHYKARSQKNVLKHKRTCSKTRNNAGSQCIPIDLAFPPPRSTRIVHPLR